MHFSILATLLFLLSSSWAKPLRLASRGDVVQSNIYTRATVTVTVNFGKDQFPALREGVLKPVSSSKVESIQRRVKRMLTLAAPKLGARSAAEMIISMRPSDIPHENPSKANYIFFGLTVQSSSVCGAGNLCLAWMSPDGTHAEIATTTADLKYGQAIFSMANGRSQ